MPKQAKPKDDSLLEMAIVGYQREVERVKARIADIKERLGQRGPGRPKATPTTSAVATETAPAAPAKRRTMSKSARARIAAAQRARWAAQKKQQTQPVVVPLEIVLHTIKCTYFACYSSGRSMGAHGV